MKTIAIILAFAFLTSGTTLASKGDSDLESRVRDLEDKVDALQSNNPKTIVVSECLAKATACKVTTVPYTVGHNAQYSYVVRQSLALAFENGTVTPITSDKTVTKKFTNLENANIAKETCETFQAEVSELLTACP